MAVISILLIVLTLLLPGLTKAKSHVHYSRWSSYMHHLSRQEGVVVCYDFEDRTNLNLLKNEATGLQIEPYAQQELDGTIGSQVDWVSGRWVSKHGLSFSGGSGEAHRVEVAPYQTWEEESLAVATWVRLDAIGGRYGLVSRYGDGDFVWGLEVLPGGKANFYVVDTNGGASEVSSSKSLAAGSWVSLIGVYDDMTEELSIYVDGQLAGRKSVSLAGGLRQLPTAGLYVGDYPALSVSSPDGVIDEVMVWNTPLSDNQIRDYIKMSDQ